MSNEPYVKLRVEFTQLHLVNKITHCMLEFASLLQIIKLNAKCNLIRVKTKALPPSSLAIFFYYNIQS